MTDTVCFGCGTPVSPDSTRCAVCVSAAACRGEREVEAFVGRERFSERVDRKGEA